MRVHPRDIVSLTSTVQKQCDTLSRYPADIALALLAELRGIAAPVTLLTAAMNDRVNGHQTLPLNDLCLLIPRRPPVYLKIMRQSSGHTIAASTINQLTRLYGRLFSVLRPMNLNTDPLEGLNIRERQMMCDAWRMICVRCLIAIYELHRLDIAPEIFDPTTPIEVLCGELRDARSGIGLLGYVGGGA